MTPTRRKTVRRLRRMSRRMTQAAAARALGVNRQWVQRLAQDYGIKFRRQRVVVKPRLCRCCDFRTDGYDICLRRKWTVRRIKRLRKRYGLSQIRMSLEVLQMNVWACARWESGRVRPSRRALIRLEQKERDFDGY